MDSIFEPFLLSLIAGMATGLGGMIVLMLRRVGDRVVSFSMGFASGVMLMVAFNNLFLEAEKLLAHIELIVVFSLGAVMMIVLDLSIPHIELATGKLDSKYRILVWNAMATIANLARVDKDRKFDAIFTKYYGFLNDEYMVTVASVVGHSSKIALAKPYLARGLWVSFAIIFINQIAVPR